MSGFAGFTFKPGETQSATPMTANMLRRMCHRPGLTTRVTCIDHAYVGQLGTAQELKNGWPEQSDSPASVFGVLEGRISSFGKYEGSKILWPAPSDIEKILTLYESGEKHFYRELRGTYCFALWDSAEKTILLGTDPLGLRHLYYARLSSGGVAFSTELKALTALPDLNSEIDPMAPFEHLVFGHLIGQRTWLRHARLVPPGAAISFPGGEPKFDAYGKCDFSDQTLDASENEMAAELSRLLRSALVDEAIDQGPAHVLVGGGINSRALLGLAAAETGVDLQAHTFGEAKSDEARSAKLNASLADVSWNFQTTGSLSQWNACQQTVHLSDGELGLCEAGMTIVAPLLRGAGALALVGSGAGLVLGAGEDGLSESRLAGAQYCQEFLDQYTGSIQSVPLNAVFQPDVAKDLPLEEMNAFVQSIHADSPSREAWQSNLYFRVRHVLPRRIAPLEHLLSRYTRAANPYFAPDVVEFGFHLPWELRQNRTLLFAALKSLNAEMALVRDVEDTWRITPSSPSDGAGSALKKYGAWLRNELRDPVEGLLTQNSEALSTVFHPRFIHSALVDHSEGRGDFTRHLLTMIQTAMVLRTFILSKDFGQEDTTASFLSSLTPRETE